MKKFTAFILIALMLLPITISAEDLGVNFLGTIEKTEKKEEHSKSDVAPAGNESETKSDQKQMTTKETAADTVSIKDFEDTNLGVLTLTGYQVQKKSEKEQNIHLTFSMLNKSKKDIDLEGFLSGELTYQSDYHYNALQNEQESDDSQSVSVGVTNDTVNYRKGPSKKAGKIKTLLKGEYAYILGTETDDAGNKWYHVERKGKTGYLMADFVDILSSEEAQQVIDSGKLSKRTEQNSVIKPLYSVELSLDFVVPTLVADNLEDAVVKISFNGNQYEIHLK